MNRRKKLTISALMTGVSLPITQQASVEAEKMATFMGRAYEDLEIRIRFKPVFIPDGNCLQRIRPENILYIEAGGNYCTIHCLENRQFMVSVLLGKFVDEFAGYKIVRCHKRFAVNIDTIEKIGGNYLVLQDDTKIDIGDTYKKDLMACMNVIGTRSTKYT